jgi:hypothetical protein
MHPQDFGWGIIWARLGSWACRGFRMVFKIIKCQRGIIMNSILGWIKWLGVNK